MNIHPRPYFSRIRKALKTVSSNPIRVTAFLEEHNVTFSSLRQGAVKYPTPPGKVRFGYLDDGTHVIYRDVRVQS